MRYLTVVGIIFSVLLLVTHSKYNNTLLNFGIYVMNVLQSEKRDGITFQDNIQSLERLVSIYNSSECTLLNKFKISVIMVKHQADLQKSLLKSLQKIQQKYNSSAYPPIVLHSLSKKAQQQYSQGHQSIIPSDRPEQLYFLIKLHSVTAKLSCDFILQHYQKHLNYFNLSQIQWRNPKDDSPYLQVYPISGFFGAGYNYDGKFQYTQYTKNYFAMIRLNGAFVSRHLMDLYSIDIAEIKKIRDIVKQKGQCYEIALNFIVGHLYVQIPPFLFNINQLKNEKFEYKSMYNMLQEEASIGKWGTKQTVQSKCIQEMSQVLGYNALKNYYSDNQFGISNWKNPSYQVITKAKRIFFESLLRPDSSNVKNSKNPIQQAVKILKRYSYKLERKQKTIAHYETKNVQKLPFQTYSFFKFTNMVTPQKKKFLQTSIYVLGPLLLILLFGIFLLHIKTRKINHWRKNDSEYLPSTQEI